MKEEQVSGSPSRTRITKIHGRRLPSESEQGGGPASRRRFFKGRARPGRVLPLHLGFPDIPNEVSGNPGCNVIDRIDAQKKYGLFRRDHNESLLFRTLCFRGIIARKSASRQLAGVQMRNGEAAIGPRTGEMIFPLLLENDPHSACYNGGSCRKSHFFKGNNNLPHSQLRRGGFDDRKPRRRQ